MKKLTGFRFTPYEDPHLSPFEKLFDIFQELITHTSGDVDEALEWLEQLDQEYQLTDEEYTLDDFIEDLKARGYLREEIDPGEGGDGEGEEGDESGGRGNLEMSAKLERLLRRRALDQIFWQNKEKRTGQP